MAFLQAKQAAAVFAVLAFSASPSHAQVLRQQLEVWAAQCNNSERDYSLDDAERACTAIIRSDVATSPARSASYRQRGAIRLERGDRAGALADFTEAVSHNPHSTPAYIGRAAIYEAQSEFERAIADYDQVVRIAPESAAAYNARCWLRSRSGRQLNLAEADCERAIELSGGAAAAYDTRGMLHLRGQRFDEAWRDYNSAIAREEGNAHYLYGRGIAALRLGRTEEGQADLTAALAIDPAIAAAYESYGMAP
ncbi:MAG: tetratricopeptide repeat protein [Phycisphaerales bacterium]|nr:tetratricopeptide repeat protein [Hyphomonadaceae bacterium]